MALRSIKICAEGRVDTELGRQFDNRDEPPATAARVHSGQIGRGMASIPPIPLTQYPTSS